jgi:hypothetical protein
MCIILLAGVLAVEIQSLKRNAPPPNPANNALAQPRASSDDIDFVDYYWLHALESCIGVANFR